MFNPFAPPEEFDPVRNMELTDQSLFKGDELGSTQPPEVFNEEFLLPHNVVDTAVSGGLQQGLESIKLNSENKTFQRLAARIQPLLSEDITVGVESRITHGGSTGIRPDPSYEDIPISLNLRRDRGKEESETTLLHESLHAVLMSRIHSLNFFSPENREKFGATLGSAELADKFRTDWESYRSGLSKEKTEKYGVLNTDWEWDSVAEEQAYLNVDEFFTRSLVDKDLRAKLGEMGVGKSRTARSFKANHPQEEAPLWERIGEAVGLVDAQVPMNPLNYAEDSANKLLDSLQDVEPDFSFIKAWNKAKKEK